MAVGTSLLHLIGQRLRRLRASRLPAPATPRGAPAPEASVGKPTWPGGGLFDEHWAPPVPTEPPLAGPVRLLVPPVGLFPDHWLGVRAMHLRLISREALGGVTLGLSVPGGGGPRVRLSLVIDGTVHHRSAEAGEEIEWAVPCRIGALELFDLVLAGGRGAVPAESGEDDRRRLTLRLRSLAFAADPAAVRVSGPATLRALDSALGEDGRALQRLSIDAEAGRALRSVTIAGRAPGGLAVPLTLEARVDDGAWSATMAPGRPFRWVLPYAAEAGAAIALTVGATTPQPGEGGGVPPAPITQVSFDPDIPLPRGADGVTMSTVLLSYNRPDLLRLTIESYLATVSVPYELIVVDNASDDETRRVIAELAARHPTIQSVLLPENLGGAAINAGVERSRGAFIHVSENDLEYLPGWDRPLLTKLERFPKLGQLSLHQSGPHMARPWTVEGMTVLLALGNVLTSSVMPRELSVAGVTWTTHGRDGMSFPSDGRFSDAVKEHGYLVAWNDVDVVVNHGFRIEELVRRLPYYVASYRSKPTREGGLAALAGMLRAGGYRLEQDAAGEWTATLIRGPEQTGDDPS